jgi:hypothetical protein
VQRHSCYGTWILSTENVHHMHTGCTHNDELDHGSPQRRVSITKAVTAKLTAAFRSSMPLPRFPAVAKAGSSGDATVGAPCLW